MNASIEKISELITTELDMLWAAHRAAGLDGFMCLYTLPDQAPFRIKQPNISFWFGPSDTDAAVQEVLAHYNSGNLPNSPLLLNPIVYSKQKDGTYKPLGSGIVWSTSLCLGIDTLKGESSDRLWELGVLASPVHRGDNERAGLKIIGICDEAQALAADGRTVIGCRELYALADISSEQYAPHYLLSGISYLTNNGLFQHPDIAELFPKDALKTEASRKKSVKDSAISMRKLLDAAYCWNAYERHHSLYKKFGINPEDVEGNLKFFNLVARDVELFDSTGPMRKEADEMFEFIIPGMVPRGSVTMLAATGGVGKSSLAHYLSVMAATDYEPGEQAPRWLGQRVAIEKCKGICVYFSGEDGPAIVNARAAIFDPRGRARRLMFQRTEFGDGASFAQHLKKLHKIPDVPIMVIDPARKYLSGDEEDSNVAGDFFSALEEFAVAKGTAVIIVHHLRKGASPKSVDEILDLLSGSQVFIDRPRVVIGMYRDGAYTIAGLAKNNIPPNLGMVTEERVFARDPKHLNLIWLPGHKGVRNASLSEEELEKLARDAKKEGR